MAAFGVVLAVHPRWGSPALPTRRAATMDHEHRDDIRTSRGSPAGHAGVRAPLDGLAGGIVHRRARALRREIALTMPRTGGCQLVAPSRRRKAVSPSRRSAPTETTSPADRDPPLPRARRRDRPMTGTSRPSPAGSDVDCGEVRPVVVADGVELSTRVDEACAARRARCVDSAADARVPRVAVRAARRRPRGRARLPPTQRARRRGRPEILRDFDRGHMPSQSASRTSSSLRSVDAPAGSAGCRTRESPPVRPDAQAARGRRPGGLLLHHLDAGVERFASSAELAVAAARARSRLSRRVDAVGRRDETPLALGVDACRCLVIVGPATRASRGRAGLTRVREP